MRVAAVASIAFVVMLTLLASFEDTRPLFQIVKKIPGRDTTGHFVVMAFLSLMVNLGFADACPGGRRLGVVRVTLLVLVGVGLEEWSQQFIPGRAMSLQDLTAGYAGILLMALVAAPFVRPGRRPGEAG